MGVKKLQGWEYKSCNVHLWICGQKRGFQFLQAGQMDIHLHKKIRVSGGKLVQLVKEATSQFCEVASSILKDCEILSFEEKRKAALMPWIKFRKSDVIIRSIYDTAYPIMPDNGLGFTRAEVYDFSHEGLLVRVSPYSIIAVYWPSIYSREQEQKGTLDVLGCVAYERNDKENIKFNQRF